MDVERIWLQRLAFASVLLVAGSSFPADESPGRGRLDEASAAGAQSFDYAADSTADAAESGRVIGMYAFVPRRAAVETQQDLGAFGPGAHGIGVGEHVVGHCPGWRLNVEYQQLDVEPVGGTLRF